MNKQKRRQLKQRKMWQMQSKFTRVLLAASTLFLMGCAHQIPLDSPQQCPTPPALPENLQNVQTLNATARTQKVLEDYLKNY